MIKSKADKPDYGNWVSTRLIYIPAAASLMFLALSFALPAFRVLAAVSLVVPAYFAYARYRFSPAGGDVQVQVQELLLAHVEWDGAGKALDIGCGNAPLTIRLAHQYPAAHVTGIDYWSEKWEYSKGICERNAQTEGVAERVAFQRASASALQFTDESFDLVVSNLVFHEVDDAKDKRELLREALRVVKKGGCFAFQDLFLLKRAFGEIDDLVATLKSWGITQVTFLKTCDAPFIPTALKLPFMLGTMGILYGVK
jgi:SAM-dependent methyltransferase